MKANQLYTRQQANDGVTTPILFPDGTPTGQTVTILSTDSDVFRKAARESNRNRIKVNELPESEQDEAHHANAITLVASLVTEWSLEDECSPENVRELLANSPTFKDLVNEVATDRSNFFSKPSKS